MGIMKTAINVVNDHIRDEDKNSLTRVFVVGCPRSGTTLLQSLLASNSKIASFPETHLFEKLFSRWSLLSALGVASRTVWPRWKIIMDEIGHPELSGYLPPRAIFVRQYSDAFVRVLDAITLSQGKYLWIEKTPGHVRHIGRIEKLVDNAKFIHIIRAGVDNIASLYEVGQQYPETWGEWYGTLDQCIGRWIEDVRRSRECSGMRNHRVIMYEELIDDPRESLIELCQFIDVPFEEKMLVDYAKSASQLILKQEQWKASVYGLIKKQGESKFYKVFNEQQRQYVLECIPKDLLSIAWPVGNR